MSREGSLSPHQTLDALWRATAQRISARHVAACAMFGIFGLAALAVQPSLGGHVLPPATLRAMAVTAVAIAAIASGVVFLLVLAAIFGGNIEVMRR